MGISTDTNRVTYSGDGSSALFAFQYEFHAQTDLAVHVWNSSRTVVDTTKTLNVDYTISGVTDAQNRYTNGANVIFNSSPASTDKIIIVRDPVVTNPFNLKFNQTIPNAELSKALDRLTIIEQRLADLTGRSIRLRDSYPLTFNGEMPAKLPAGGAVIISSSGVGIEIGVAVVNSSSAGAYYGILPVANGGTGLDFSILQGLIYSPGNNSTFQNINNGTPGLVMTSNGSSAPSFQAFSTTLINSGILKVEFGGTGTGTSYIQNGVLFASSATQMANTLAGGADVPLVGNGASAPSFKALNLASNSSVTGTLAIAHGGHGQTTANAGFNALSPMTAGGDIIYGGTSGVAVALPNGSLNTVLTSQGGSFPPVWASPTANLIIADITDLSAETLSNATDVAIISGAAGTLELYSTANNQGKSLLIKSAGAKLVDYTLQAATSQLIVGMTGKTNREYIFRTNGEAGRFVAQGSSWVMLDHSTYTGPVNNGSSVIAATTTVPVKGSSFIVDHITWSRDGAFCDVGFALASSSAAAAGTAGSGDYLICLPPGIKFDQSVLKLGRAVAEGGSSWEAWNCIGTGNLNIKDSTSNTGICFAFDASSFRIATQSLGIWSSGAFAFNAALSAAANVRFAVDGWEP